MRITRRITFLALAALSLIAVALAFTSPGRRCAIAAYNRLRTLRTVEQQLDRYGPSARARTAPAFAAANIPYPPSKLLLLAFKAENRLDLHAAATPEGEPRFVKSYPILAASGGPGPKLREGDRQTPEGFYRIESLNPNSLYHLALRLDYPNADDRAQAAIESRTHLGGDIMIHGGSASIGCLAMGDPAIEELFVAAADVGIANIEALIAPADLRITDHHDPRPWVEGLHLRIKSRLQGLETPRR